MQNESETSPKREIGKTYNVLISLKIDVNHSMPIAMVKVTANNPIQADAIVQEMLPETKNEYIFTTVEV